MTYFRNIWKVNSGFTIFSMVFISLFQLLILYLVTTFDTQAMLRGVMEQMPKNLRIFLNDSFFSMLNFDGAAAFGFSHPMVLTMLAIVAISIPVRHISREIENGNMELLLSLPLKRKSLIMKLWGAGLFIIAIIVISSLVGSLIAILIFHELNTRVFLLLLETGLNLFLLFAAIMSFTLYVATASRGGSFAGNLSAGIVLLFYMLFFIGQIWDFLKPTLYINLFNYYQPQKILLGNGFLWVDYLAYAGLTILFLFLGLKKFNNRDIP